MKNIWNKEEIQNQHGHIIIKNSVSKPFKDLGYARTVTFKIGFGKMKYGLCNILTDGWYHDVCNTAEEFAEFLNKDEIGYRPITKEEFIELLLSTNQNFY
jgi:hypothetical protein